MDSDVIIAILIAYFAAYVVIGYFAARKTITPEDYLVAGHRMGLIVATGTYFATFISALSFLGSVGGIYRAGISNVIYPVMWATGSIFGLIVAPRFRKVAMNSPGEFYSIRYGSKGLRALVGLATAVSLIPFFIIQLQAIGAVYTFITGRPPIECVIISAIVVALYTVAGGIIAVAWTDVLQGFALTLAAIAGGIVVWQLTGGLGNIYVQASQISTPPEPGMSPTAVGALVAPAAFLLSPAWLIGQWLTHAPGTGVHPQYLQRIQAAKNVEISIKMYIISWAVLTVIYFCFVIIGLGGRVLVPTMPKGISSDWIFPYLIKIYFPPVLAGITYAGILAAALSTLDTQIHLAATLLAVDGVKNLYPRISEKTLLWLSRGIVTLLVVIAAVLTAYPLPTILTLGGYTLGLMGVLYFVPVLLGLYWRRATREGAIVGVVAGLVVFIIWQTLFGFGVYGIPPTGMGVLTCLVLMIVVSLITKPPKEEMIKPFMET